MLQSLLARGLSSAGRAPALQAGGHRFEPCRPHCGGIPEWPKGADCKSVSNAFGGSNPPSPTLLLSSRGRAVRKLVGLITRRSQVQILPPLLRPGSSVGRAAD